ncbi:MAG: dihydroneopterin aldolase [Bacteroidia bacterium]
MKIITALENVKFYAYHGIYNFEKEKGGEFVVNVYIEEEIDLNKNLNDLNSLINYEKLFEIVKDEMENTKNLIEEVASVILQRISHLLIDKKAIIKVKIDKINPVGKFGSGNASVTIIQ